MTNREIDDAIVVKVMKWPIDEAAPLHPGPWYRDDATGMFCTTNPKAPTSGQPGRYFSPSTDIAAAWQVVEKMGRDNFNFDIEWKAANRSYPNSAEASFSTTLCTRGHCCNDSAPLAICLAALSALEGK